MRMRVAGTSSHTHKFFIRGKNPKDQEAKSYIDAHVDVEFRDYAWMIAKHEGKSTNHPRYYNQFNPDENRYKELPNWGTPYGWGIGQIDKGIDGTTTAEVYDWHENVASMNRVLRSKRNRYEEVVGWFRAAYQNDPAVNWSEPDNVTTNVSGHVFTAKEWTIITLYNGAGGTPYLSAIGHPRERSPIHFDPRTSSWKLYTNDKNYAPMVYDRRNLEEVE